MWAQADLRRILSRIGARVLDPELAVGNAGSRFDEAGPLADDFVRDQLEEIVAALVDSARARDAVAA